jgi:hypothetical protein
MSSGKTIQSHIYGWTAIDPVDRNVDVRDWARSTSFTFHQDDRTMTPIRQDSRAPSLHSPASGSSAPFPACPRCGSHLDLHQPQPNLPDRLLGTCDSCDLWAVIEVGRDGLKTILTVLPEPTGSFCPT